MTPGAGATWSPDGLVSVVIVNWNSRRLLESCVESLRQNSDGLIREVIVVDNGSVDDSVEFVRSTWNDVTAVALPRNQGFGVANNIGFALAAGRYVLVLNPDTRVLPGMLSTMVGVMEDDESIGCTGAKHYNTDLSLQWSIDHFPTLLSETLHYCSIDQLPVLQDWLPRRFPRYSDHDERIEVDWVNGACMLASRAAIDATGGFDEYFFLFAEELDWCLRIWRAGFRVVFLPDAGVVHDLGGTFRPTDRNRLPMIYQSSLRFFRRHRSPLAFLGLTVMIRINAIVRIALLGLAAFRQTVLRRKIPADRWRALSQVGDGFTVREMLKTWVGVLTVRTHSDLRPTPPSGSDPGP